MQIGWMTTIARFLLQAKFFLKFEAKPQEFLPVQLLSILDKSSGLKDLAIAVADQLFPFSTSPVRRV